MGVNCHFSHEQGLIAATRIAQNKAKPKGPPPKRQGAAAPGGVAILMGAASLLIESGEFAAARADDVCPAQAVDAEMHHPPKPYLGTLVDLVKAGVGTIKSRA